MSAAAVLLMGLPPFGLGVYARERLEDGYPYGFAAVNAWRTDAPQQAEQLRALGRSVWLYGTPEQFNPQTWRAGVQRLQERSQSIPGVSGVIADPESGWPGLSSAARDREARELGRALAALATSIRVGVTSYPLFPALDALADGCGRSVWGSPQIYGRTSQDGETFRAWFDTWRERFGSRCIPSIAGWASSPPLSSADGFRRYLAALPAAAGAIAWDATGRAPSYIADALTDYSPGGSPAATAALVGASIAMHPPFIALVVVLAVVALLLASSR